MSGLAAAARTRIVTVDGVRHEIRPPTVREAVETLHAIERMNEEEDGLLYLLLTVLPGWFPADFVPVFDDMDLAAQLKCLTHLMYQGIVRPKKRGEGDGDEEGDRKPAEWDDVVGTYCMTYHADPWYVYNEVPFPYFMTMVLRADRQLARHTLAHLELHDLPHVGKGRKNIILKLQRRAGHGNSGVPRKGTRKEIREGRAKLRELFGGRG